MSKSFCLGCDFNGTIVLHNMDMPKLIICREESKFKFKNAKSGEGSGDGEVDMELTSYYKHIKNIPIRGTVLTGH